MAEQDLTFRIKFDGTEAAARETGKVTKQIKNLNAAQKANVSTATNLAARSKDIAGKFGNIATAAGPLASQIGRLNQSAGALGSAFSSMGGAVTGLAAGFGPLGFAIGGVTAAVGVLSVELADNQRRMETYRKTVQQTVGTLDEFISAAQKSLTAQRQAQDIRSGRAGAAAGLGALNQARARLAAARRRRMAVVAARKVRAAGGDMSGLSGQEFTALRAAAGDIEGSGGRAREAADSIGGAGAQAEIDRLSQQIAELESEVTTRRGQALLGIRTEAAGRAPRGGGRAAGRIARAGRGREAISGLDEKRKADAAERERLKNIEKENATIHARFEAQARLQEEARDKERRIEDERIAQQQAMVDSARTAAQEYAEAWNGSTDQVIAAFNNANAAFAALGHTQMTTSDLMVASSGSAVNTMSDLFEDNLTSAIESNVQAWVTGEKSIGEAAQAILSQTMSAVASEAAVKALFETASGFAALFTNPAEATAHFTAAGIFGATAAAAGAASAVAGAAGGGGGGARGGAASPAGFGSQTRAPGGDRQAPTTVVVQVSGLMSEADTGRVVASSLGAAQKQYGGAVLSDAGLRAA